MTDPPKAQRLSWYGGRGYVDAVTIYWGQRFGIGRYILFNENKVNKTR